MPLHLLFLLVAIPFVEYFFENRKITYIFLILISFLLLIQNFFTIDIISMKLFGTFRWGKYTFIKIGDYAQSRCDGMVYNSQYTHIQLLYSKLHQVLGTTPYSLIVNNLENNQPSSKWVQQYDYAPIIEVVELQKFVPKGQVYYVFLPWLTNNIDEGMAEIKKYYSVGEGKTIDINGYWLRYYKLSRLTR